MATHFLAMGLGKVLWSGPRRRPLGALACRIYYDKNREAILAQQMQRYKTIRQERIAKGEFEKRGPKPKPREVMILESVRPSAYAQ